MWRGILQPTADRLVVVFHPIDVGLRVLDWLDHTPPSRSQVMLFVLIELPQLQLRVNNVSGPPERQVNNVTKKNPVCQVNNIIEKKRSASEVRSTVRLAKTSSISTKNRLDRLHNSYSYWAVAVVTDLQKSRGSLIILQIITHRACRNLGSTMTYVYMYFHTARYVPAQD